MKENGLTREIPTDNSKICESNANPNMVQNDLCIPSVVQLYIEESFFSKSKGHMNNVPPFQNAQKKLQSPKSKMERSSHFQAKRRVTIKAHPLKMGTPPSLYSKN